MIETGMEQAIASLNRIPRDQLPSALARAIALLRAEGIDVSEEARKAIRELPFMRPYAPLLMTDEERIDELYDCLRQTEGAAERTDLLRQLRGLQKREAERLVKEGESSLGFQPREAMAAIAGARRLVTQHAPSRDDTAAEHQD